MTTRRQFLKLNSLLSISKDALKGTSLKIPAGAQSISSSSNLATATIAATPKQRSIAHRFRNLLRDYKQLSKAKLSLLVVATSAAGYAAGSKETIEWKGLGWTSLGTMLTASSANALNQVYEVINDSKMKRTAARPLPAGRMSRVHALAFAAFTGVSGVWLLNEKTNTLAASLAGGNILLYAGVYTPLKQVSVMNTWIGAIVGAVPPLLGWAAAAGILDIGAALLASGLYFWQMPHFMALAWLCRADYAAGGYRMLSLVDATGKRTAACALRNCAYLFPLGILASWLDVTTPYFAYESSFITAGLLLTAAQFYSKPSQANARLLFKASLFHLPIFMIAFLIHRKPNMGQNRTELLAHNASLLGLRNSGSSHVAHSTSTLHGDTTKSDRMTIPLHADVGDYSRSHSGDAMKRQQTRFTLPPLPFLPIPHLQYDDNSGRLIECPSKALCEKDAMGADEKKEREKNMK